MKPTFTKLSLVALACSAMFAQANASATSLLQAYQAALKNDPLYRAAQADNRYGQQAEVIGRAGLLPQVQYSFSKSMNKGEQTAPNILGKLAMTDLDYQSSSKGVSVRQPLFALDSYARFKQGQAQTLQSNAQFDARAKDLMVRVLAAYSDAKFGEEQVALYTAQRDFLLEQKKVNDLMFSKGEAAKTDMLETQAKLDVAEAILLEAQDNLQNARTTLAGIVGAEITTLDSLKEDFSVSRLIQGDLNEWKTIAEKNSPEITAAQLNLEIAEQEIAKSRAGHAPRVDLNASYSHGKSETVTTQTQDNNIRSIGFQVVIPIYSGGSASAVSKQAVAQKDRAKSDLDGARIKVMNELQKQFNAVRVGAIKVEAFQRSVASAQTLVEATRQSIKGGMRINLDLLNAQQQLVTAKRDLAQARYNYLSAFLRLKVAAGVAGYEDMQVVAGFFSGN